MISSLRVPDDERKGRRLGDETKGRIANLASGWTVDGESPPPPEPFRREPARRKPGSVPPPPPGSPARRAAQPSPTELEDRMFALLDDAEADDDGFAEIPEIEDGDGEHDFADRPEEDEEDQEDEE